MDIISAPAPVDATAVETPAFVRAAMCHTADPAFRDGVEPRVELVTPPRVCAGGVFLPLLVEEDGVVDPITKFTRSSGRFRQRRGCFLRLSPSERPTRLRNALGRRARHPPRAGYLERSTGGGYLSDSADTHQGADCARPSVITPNISIRGGSSDETE